MSHCVHFLFVWKGSLLNALSFCRTVEVPSSRIVVIEGIYSLSEKLRPLLDLRVSITGGVHFDLVKRVLRDIQRAGQEPEEIIHQISETVLMLLLTSCLFFWFRMIMQKSHSCLRSQVYPMYKAFIEPDLETAHIRIINKFNPFSGFQNPIYILKVDHALLPSFNLCVYNFAYIIPMPLYPIAPRILPFFYFCKIVKYKMFLLL